VEKIAESVFPTAAESVRVHVQHSRSLDNLLTMPEMTLTGPGVSTHLNRHQGLSCLKTPIKERQGTDVAELDGNLPHMRFLIIVIVLMPLLARCQADAGENSNGDPDQRVEIAVDWKELRDRDQGLFLASMFFLPEIKRVFKDRGRWIGQTPSSFEDLMDQQEKDLLFEAFTNKMDQLDFADQNKVATRIERWGHFYHIFSQVGSNYSHEELLASFWSTGEFNNHFEPAFQSRNLDPRQMEPIDLAATLSSTESIDIFLNIVTDVALMDPDPSIALIRKLFDHLN